jgi:hypothetical protein
MNAQSPLQWMWRAVSWLHARPAILGTWAGAGLGVSTVILSAINAISAQQAIAMALPAIVALVGGLLHTTMLDAWTAWQRGFQQGCQTGMPCRQGDLSPVVNPGVAAVPGRDEVAGEDRLTAPVPRAALRRVL